MDPAEVNHAFFDAVDAILRALGVTEFETRYGLDSFRFWQEQKEDFDWPPTWQQPTP